MSDNLFRRFGWAIYSGVGLFAAILFLLSKYRFTDGNFHDLLSNLASDLLAGALIFFIVDQVFKWRPDNEKTKEQETYLLQLREQISRAEKTLNGYQQFTQHLTERLLGGRYLTGEQAIYRSAIQLYESAKDHIRIVQLADGPQPPDDYAEITAKMLAAKKSQGKYIKFEIVLVLNQSTLPPDFSQRMSARFQIYKKHGVEDLLSLNILDSKSPVGFTFFIVDRKHVHISLTKKPGIQKLQSAIVFENQAYIATDLTDWFDQIVVRAASPYLFETDELINIAPQQEEQVVIKRPTSIAPERAQ